MRAAVVIPTYWGRPVDVAAPPGDRTFDHPTAIDGPETLGRCLESLERLEGQAFAVALVLATTTDEVEEAAEARVRDIVGRLALPFPCRLYGRRSARALAERLGHPEGSESILALDGYGNVRNACILAALLLDAEAAVLVDDDEVVEDPGFLGRALSGLGTMVGKEPASGVAGYYRDRDGGYRLPERDEPWEAIWGKVRAMNDAFARHVEGRARYAPTFLALGGNMVIGAGLAREVPFDPGIRRGEDMDYVFNARLLGHGFVFDRELWIRHLPPPRGHSAAVALREDAARFLHARAKLRRVRERCEGEAARLTRDDLLPYPGRFLGDDLEDLVQGTFESMIDRGSATLAEEARAGLDAVQSLPGWRGRPEEALDGYVEVRRAWRQLVCALQADSCAGVVLEWMKA